jgi:hypothetical protein
MNTILAARPDDRKKEKDEEWGKQYVAFIASHANNNYDSDWQVRYRNYRYINNQLYQEEFQQYCDPFDWDKGKGLDYVQPLNKLHNVVNVLRGEELRRLFKYSVVDVSPNATNERLRKEKREYAQRIEFELEKAIKIQQAEIQKQAAIKMTEYGDIQNPEELQQIEQQVMQELQSKEQYIANFDEIREKYKNYITAQEKAMNKLLKQFINHKQIKFKKNIGFFDAVVAAGEFVKVELVNGLVELELLNPLGVTYHKSPEIEWVHKGDYACYKREMSIKEVKRLYGDYLSDEDVKLLTNISQTVYGLDARVHSRDAESPSHFQKLNSGYMSQYYNANVIHPGGFGYGNATSDTVNMCTVYDCFWVTERYVGLYTYMDEFGTEQAEFVDHKFKAPKTATKFKETDELGITKFYWEWEDEAGPHRLYYTWIPYLYRGTIINNNIYCKIEPMPEIFQVTPDNPYDIELPIYGASYNNRNAPFMSVVDYMLPWYKIYLIIMSKFLANVAKDHGGFTAINTLFLSDKVDVETSIQYAMKMGFLPFNPLQNSQGAGIVNNIKPAEYVQVSNVQNIRYYAELAKFIEDEIFKAGGVPRERLGQTAPGTNVSDNRQDLMQSAYITEYLYYTHELIWEAALQSVTLLLAATVDKNHPYVRDILSDDEISVIEAGVITKNSRFRFQLSNNSESTRIKDISEQYMQAMIQNDKTNLSTFLKMLRKGDISGELIQEIELMEKNVADRQQQMEQQQMQMQQQQIEAQKEAADKQYKQVYELKRMELDTKERIAMIGSFSRQQDLDADDNGIYDQMEASLAMKETQQKDRELDLREREIENKRKIEQSKLNSNKSK